MSVEVKGSSYYAMWIGGSLNDVGVVDLLKQLGWTATWLTNPCAEIDVTKITADEDIYIPKRDFEMKTFRAGEHDRSRYPHSCPHCGGPAYVGMNDVDCMRRCQ